MSNSAWQPVYFTEDERADVAARLIMRGEDASNPDERKRCLYLASLLVFATTPEVRA